MNMHSLLVLVTLISLSCNKRENSSDKFYQKPLAEEVISQYEKLINISPIEDSKFDHEIRHWGEFVKDSFPAGMDRLVLSNNNIKLERYLFFTHDTSLISSVSGNNCNMLCLGIIT